MPPAVDAMKCCRCYELTDYGVCLRLNDMLGELRDPASTDFGVCLQTDPSFSTPGRYRAVLRVEETGVKLSSSCVWELLLGIYRSVRGALGSMIYFPESWGWWGYGTLGATRICNVFNKHANPVANHLCH